MISGTFDSAEKSGDAILSPSGTYRYLLQRFWNPRLETLNFIMLNPSTADASVDDPTIRRCLGFARDLGFGSIEVTNLFALRSTDPKAIRAHPCPIGPENDETIINSAKVCQMTVCAWGNHGDFMGRSKHVLGLLREAGITPHALRVSKTGAPGHPLYLPADLQPAVLDSAS